MNIIEINNLSFDYGKKIIFNGLNLNIEKNTFTTIIGNSCGKTSLAQILCGNLKYNGEVLIDNIIVTKKNKRELSRKIKLLSENPEKYFLKETVIDEITYLCDGSDVIDNFNYLKKLFQINDILYKNPMSLSAGEKQLISFIQSILLNPKIIIIDNAFTMVDSVLKKKIFEYLKKQKENKKMTIINITNDIEESLYGENIVVMYNGEIKYDCKIVDILKKEKQLKKIGFDIPFIISLSNKLKYYDLVDHTYYSIRKLVDDLWQ
ncbi:MAG: ATP-binding cassette domain-containing protein [Bacilli bacterium]|nr:ATP-binding cassette domain-containing protein [Bacilli bacterium]